MHLKLPFILLVGLLLSGCCKFSRRSAPDQHTSPLFLAASQERSALLKEGLSIYFASGSAAITNESKERMHALTSALKELKRVTLVLRGYADRSEKQAFKLARQRVAEVRHILDRSGAVDGSVAIKQEAFGDNDPLITYNTVNNNPHSRRVDVFILSQ